ncbi:toxin-antitoxin system TumE family protein [Moorella sp. Hama-1]|uniref:toxin-antitoxin system TumE family protein n=1 Tax=Moorella sp. Hama-1 TaxID=2138101 RepID=UPI001F240632|nr:DUF6516 family protein [Moorella sp. Hama-1]BCV22964.1 hypothetical protein hamaS1_30330 [Moorella sp. Hama-1]
MLNTLRSFQGIIKSYAVELFERETNRRRLKATITFIDESKLFVKDYSFGSERKYSFHWVDKYGRLIVRWDNAPHWRQIATFPHHKHVCSHEKVEPSLEMELSEILTAIMEEIS